MAYSPTKSKICWQRYLIKRCILPSFGLNARIALYSLILQISRYLNYKSNGKQTFTFEKQEEVYF